MPGVLCAAAPLPCPAEYYGDLAGASYYSVAVVPKDFCADSSSFADLKVGVLPWTEIT